MGAVLKIISIKQDLVRPRFNQVKAAPSYKTQYEYMP